MIQKLDLRDWVQAVVLAYEREGFNAGDAR